MEEQTPPAAPSATAPPQHPASPATDAAYPTPPAEGGRSHVGLIVGSIVGGALLLGLTFAGGAALGWWIGSHNGGPAMYGPAFDNGPQPPGWGDRQPGDRAPDGQDDQDDSSS